VVVAEDDPDQARVLGLYLEREGFDVVHAADGTQAIAMVREHHPALLVLDVMMPRLDGLAVCRIVRAEFDVPILMLTARTGEDDVLDGLERGADDYVAKPYRPRELMARIRTLLRRTTPTVATAPTVVTYRDLVIDEDRRSVHQAGAEVSFTASEFDLLRTLAAGPGRVWSRAQLLDALTDHGADTLERTVDVHVRNVRRKLDDDPRDPRYVATVIGLGYEAP